MRLFLIHWSGGLPELTSVAAALKEGGHQIIYWVMDRTYPLDRSRFSETVFHDVGDAIHGLPADIVRDSPSAPPSESLLRELAPAESVVLTMMNKRFGHLSVAERKHFYYTLVRYWSAVLERYKPECIIFPLVPHTVYDFVIYALAKHLGIKTLMFTATQDFIRLIPMNDFIEGHRVIRDALKQEYGRQFRIDEISEDIRRYITKHTEAGADPTPTNMWNLKRYRPKKSTMVLRAIRDLSILGKGFSYLRKRCGSNLQKEYARVVGAPDFTKKFVYVPLQYQPEATTSPLGGVFVDQRFLVETLAAALPPDWLVYVKEHPRQLISSGLNFSQYRYKGYYEGLATLSNVRVVPTETDTFALMDAAQAVALNTGTAGLEAVLRGKPVLVFGYAWYRDCPSIFRVDNTEECRKAFAAIQAGFSITRDSLINFFAAVDRTSFRGYLEMHTKKLSGISESENTANLTKAILTELKR